MFIKPSKDMSATTAPLLLTQPVEAPAVQSVEAELTDGPAPERPTHDDVSKMVKEITQRVYGATQQS